MLNNIKQIINLSYLNYEYDSDNDKLLEKNIIWEINDFASSIIIKDRLGYTGDIFNFTYIFDKK